MQIGGLWQWLRRRMTLIFVRIQNAFVLNSLNANHFASCCFGKSFNFRCCCLFV